jgi:hypothetical protein
MKSQIVEKLKEKFIQTTLQESDIVYILIEIYKFLEQKK